MMLFEIRILLDDILSRGTFLLQKHFSHHYKYNIYIYICSLARVDRFLEKKKVRTLKESRFA